MKTFSVIGCVLILAGCDITPTAGPLAPKTQQTSVNLAWDSGSFVSYRVYYGPMSRVYDRQVETEETIATISNLAGGNNFFAVSGFNSDGIESGLSNEVSVVGIGPTATPIPTPEPTAIPGPTQIPGPLTLNPATVNITIRAGTNPPTQMINVSGANWSATGNKPWITIHCATGNCGGSFFLVEINTAGMPPGSYSGTVQVVSGNTSKALPVVLAITSSNPTATPNVTVTPRPTATATPGPTATPNATPKPSVTPKPTPKPTPSVTPRPTTRRPTPTPTP